jgi:ferredoxin
VTERLLVDPDVCIGAGLCVVAQPRVFDQDEDGIVTVLMESPPLDDDIRQAVATCPSGALSLRDDGSP